MLIAYIFIYAYKICYYLKFLVTLCLTVCKVCKFRNLIAIKLFFNTLLLLFYLLPFTNVNRLHNNYLFVIY